MSLVFGGCFSNGILFACDPFILKNDGKAPQKLLSFRKFWVSHNLGYAFVSIGSLQVFSNFCEWLENDDNNKGLDSLAEKWSEINNEWKNTTKHEIDTSDLSTLRPISDSVLFVCKVNELTSIYIIDASGKINQTSTFVFSGSGTYLVTQFLQTTGSYFDSTNSIQESFLLLQKCFLVARNDLYVSGFPSIIAVTPNNVIDLSDKCADFWFECENLYFDNLQKLISMTLE